VIQLVVFEAVIINLISTIVFIGVNGLILWFVSRWMHFIEKSPKTAFFVSAIAGAVGFVLNLTQVIISALSKTIAFSIIAFIVNVAVFVLLIMKFYRIRVFKAGIVWAVIFAVDLLIGFLLGILLALFAGALRFGGVIY